MHVDGRSLEQAGVMGGEGVGKWTKEDEPNITVDVGFKLRFQAQ